jgi:hypothetical protein
VLPLPMRASCRDARRRHPEVQHISIGTTWLRRANLVRIPALLTVNATLGTSVQRTCENLTLVREHQSRRWSLIDPIPRQCFSLRHFMKDLFYVSIWQQLDRQPFNCNDRGHA